MSKSSAQASFPQEENRNDEMENWIKAVAAGDRDALGKLYEKTHVAVFAFALSIVKNREDAEDVLQDVYVRVWQSAADYREMGKAMAWILTITRNAALTELRRRNKTVLFAPEEWKGTALKSSDMNAEDALLLGSVMEHLGEEERQIVILHAVAGLKHRECAQLLDLGLSTVLSKYSRALKKLRDALEEVQ